MLRKHFFWLAFTMLLGFIAWASQMQYILAVPEALSAPVGFLYGTVFGAFLGALGAVVVWVAHVRRMVWMQKMGSEFLA